MQKLLLILVSSLLILSCGQNSQKEENQKESTIKNDSEVGNQNFGVIWNWVDPDQKNFENKFKLISEEFSALWKSNIIENVYLNTETPGKNLVNLPNIAFFIKAHSQKEAQTTLNKLTIVHEGIASYELIPVGLLWLDRKTEVVEAKGIKNSFISIWHTSNPEKSTESITKEQNDNIISLWNNGVIENVYFDLDGIKQKNAQKDFVFFINASSEEEARVICDGLPFVKEGIAGYQLYSSGEFWLGSHEVQPEKEK